MNTLKIAISNSIRYKSVIISIKSTSCTKNVKIISVLFTSCDHNICILKRLSKLHVAPLFFNIDWFFQAETTHFRLCYVSWFGDLGRNCHPRRAYIMLWPQPAIKHHLGQHHLLFPGWNPSSPCGRAHGKVQEGWKWWDRTPKI